MTFAKSMAMYTIIGVPVCVALQYSTDVSGWRFLTIFIAGGLFHMITQRIETHMGWDQ